MCLCRRIDDIDGMFWQFTLRQLRLPPPSVAPPSSSSSFVKVIFLRRKVNTRTKQTHTKHTKAQCIKPYGNFVLPIWNQFNADLMREKFLLKQQKKEGERKRKTVENVPIEQKRWCEWSRTTSRAMIDIRFRWKSHADCELCLMRLWSSIEDFGYRYMCIYVKWIDPVQL